MRRNDNGRMLFAAALTITYLAGGCTGVPSTVRIGSAPHAAPDASAPPMVEGVEGGSASVRAAATAEGPHAFVAPALPSATVAAEPTTPPTPTPDPFVVAGPPLSVEIPSIGVTAQVELVGLTADRAMDVPRGWMNVGWYRDGYRPGEPGNSVLAGHLDTTSGGPAVFWALDQVQPGDEVIVTYGNGDRYTFVVEGQELYEHDAAGPIIDRIFGESLTADLNLVTCDGAWDHGHATYTHRLVVFTTLAPEKTVRAPGSRPRLE